MNFEQLRRRVERAEAVVERRRELIHAHRSRLKAEWHAAWTPGRILLAGLVAGFVSGRANTSGAVRKLGRLGAVGGPRILQLVSSLSTMLTSLQAAMAAATAKQAAETADEAATTAEAAATGGPAATAAAAAAGAAAAREEIATGGAGAAGAAPATRTPADAAVDAAAAATGQPAPVETPAPPVSDRPRRADPAIDAATPPRAAEAATDVSER